MATMSSVETIKKVMDLLQHARMDEWSTFMDDAAVVETPFAAPGMPCRYTGRAEWEQMMRAWFGATFDSFAWSDVELHAGADPNRVFGTGKSRGVMKDGRVYENEYSWIFRLRDGRIVDYIEYFNPLNIIKTFGSQGDTK